MKNTLRMMSVLFALVLCVGVMAACGNTTAQPTAAPTTAAPTTEGTEPSVPFVAPPDAIGLVVSADLQLVTWQAYTTTEDTIDFKSVDVKALGTPAEMSLVYMESEVSYYSLVGGKLEQAQVTDVVPGSVIGITTLEEGVMEVYILSVPVEEEIDEEDPLEDLTEETLPAESTAPADDDV